jgi:hypothetical protein
MQSGEQQRRAQVAGSHFLPVLPVSVQVPRKLRGPGGAYEE